MSKRTGDGVSPREILTGVKPNFKKCLPVAFGDFCQVLERNPDNTMASRTVSALALLPTGNGPVKFASLATGKTITRERFTIVHNVPYEMLAIVKTMQERSMIGIEDLLNPGMARGLEEEEVEALARSQGQYEGNLAAEPENNEQVVEVVGDEEPNDDSDDESEDDDDDSDEDEDDVEEEESEVLVTEAVPLDTFCMTINQAYSMYPAEKVDEAIEKELTNMIEMEVFGLVPPQERALISKKFIVPSPSRRDYL